MHLLSPPRSNRSSAAFTLIELLVVITIIGILAGVTYPVFMRSQRSAKAVQCINNLRQLGIAFGSYATDNDGKFPPVLDTNATPDEPDENADSDVGVWSYVLVDKGYINEPDSAAHNPFRCPFCPDANGEGGDGIRSYAYNDGRKNPATDPPDPPSRFSVVDSAKTILLAEWWHPDKDARPETPNWDKSGEDEERVSAGIYDHHENGKSGVLFYDLHAEEVKAVPEVPRPGWPTSDNPTLKWYLTPQE